MNVRYSYESRALGKSSLPLTYSYTSAQAATYESPVVGFKAPATQQILNNLPQWMAMRQDNQSAGWQLANSWGQNLELVVDQVKDFLASKFLASADVAERSSVYSINLKDRELLQNRGIRNLLFNSSFTLRGPTRTGLPSGWSRYNSQDTNRVFLIRSKPFICPHSMTIIGSGTFGQAVELNNSSVKDLTASIYYTTLASRIDIRAVMIVEMEDATTKFLQLTQTEPSSIWRRMFGTLDVSGKVYRVHFVVYSSTDSAAYFNAPKVEIAGQVSSWTSSVRDTLPYVESSTNFSQVCSVWG